MKITVRIKRFHPESIPEARFEDYEVEAEGSDRVLDVLMYVKRNMDGTVSFRKSCAHGVCGSDGMTINGVERLACKTLVQEVAAGSRPVVTLEPLRLLGVQRDLMVDYRRFFEVYRLVKPFLIPVRPAEQGETIQTPQERKAFDDPTKCILCASCYSACPVLADTDREFVGPAAIVQAARFVLDSHDEGIGPRLAVLDDEHGVWPCENHMECTRVCPRGIKVTRNINLMKRAIKKYKEQDHQTS